MKKNKLKKSIALILSLGMALSLCTACSTDNAKQNETQTTRSSEDTSGTHFLYSTPAKVMIHGKVIKLEKDKTMLLKVTLNSLKEEGTKWDLKKNDEIYVKYSRVDFAHDKGRELSVGDDVISYAFDENEDIEITEKEGKKCLNIEKWYVD